MNYDKIDTLLVVAGCRFEFLHGKDYEDFSPYKFAELIVRECVGVCDDERDSTDSDFVKLGTQRCALKILERFGVTE